MTFDERIVTKTPPAAAFLYLSDLGNAVSWDPSITRVEQLTPGPVGVGTRFRVTLRIVGVKATLDYHVEVYEPERRIVFFGRGNGTTVTDTVLVTPYRGGSRVRWIAEIKLIAPLRLIDPILGMLFRPNINTAVTNLKRALDRIAVPKERRDEAGIAPMHPATAARRPPAPDAGIGAAHG
jgi:carbon monoxide dehydrogenase subunit G